MFNALEFSKRSVRVGLGDGAAFNCPMLPVADIAAFRTAKADFTSGVRDGEPEKIDAAAAVLFELVSAVIPDKYRDGLTRLSPFRLLALATYLMYGDMDDAPVDSADDDAKKKD